MSCTARLWRYDTERDEAQRNAMAASMWGVESKDSAAKSPRSNGRKQTMTARDIMRNYKK